MNIESRKNKIIVASVKYYDEEIWDYNMIFNYVEYYMEIIDQHTNSTSVHKIFGITLWKWASSE